MQNIIPVRRKNSADYCGPEKIGINPMNEKSDTIVGTLKFCRDLHCS